MFGNRGNHALQRGDPLGVRAGALVLPFRRKEFQAEFLRPWTYPAARHSTNHAGRTGPRRWDHMRLAHGWELVQCPGFKVARIAEVVRPAVHPGPTPRAARRVLNTASICARLISSWDR